MANWNGSYFPPPGNTQNFNYLPQNFPENNVHPYAGAGVSWAYTEMSPRLALQSPAYSNQPSQGMYGDPTSSNAQGAASLSHTRDEMLSLDKNLAIAAASNLTATAGEFVPRSIPRTGIGTYEQQDGGVEGGSGRGVRYVGHLDNYKPSRSGNGSYEQREGRRGSSYNRHLENEPRPSYQSRGRDNPHRGSGRNMSSRDPVLDDERIRDRHRLLEEAAAFLVSQEPRPQQPQPSTKPRAAQQDPVGPRQQQQAERVYTRFRGGPGSRGGKRWPHNGNANHPWPMAGEERGKVGKKQAEGGSNRASPRMEPWTAADGDISQRERLTDQLTKGTLECLVCCERLRHHEPIWHCTKCYHVLHLSCITKWARASKSDNGWRCPACQNYTVAVPTDYYCFCGKLRDPEWNRLDTPHSCGDVCGLSREASNCPHHCTLLCHPGPCPPCTAHIKRCCGCGKVTQLVKCASEQLLCSNPCGKLLNCGLHECAKPCHFGACSKCEEKIKQDCYCGQNVREVFCKAGVTSDDLYSCLTQCKRKSKCGNHVCLLKCHLGPCKQCPMDPDIVTHCPCGKTELQVVRTSCLDPIPPCDLVCNSLLTCGGAVEHRCQETCHSGECPPCPLSTTVRCRCGNMDQTVSCVVYLTLGDDVRCNKKCTKKRNCGKHKCNRECCLGAEHGCTLICNHLLNCGQHRCESLCHRGHCNACWRDSYDELYCECGASVTYPPVPCGTKRPECANPCSRQHPCLHPPTHNCHSEPTCPPCTVLTQKWCYGKHELRKAVPCHQTELSCGLPCNVKLPCGRHLCIQPCHKGPCLKEGQVCLQPCTSPRSLCGHNCSAPCHEGPCPDIPCKEMVKVSCECGNRATSRACSDQAKEYQRIATSLLASKMADMQLGHTIDITDLLGSQRKISLKTLECNDECKIIERNRRMAIGLQIRNPDLSAKLTPRYSDYMRGWAKKDPFFCNSIHDKLTILVQLAKQSKQKSRSHSFDSMNRDKRHFVHEYCDHFGCESVAYDQEPKRNVVATAARDKAWLPSMSLLEVLQRESGQRKVPKPIITSTVPAPRTMDVLPGKVAQSKTPNPSTSKQPVPDDFDYFDCT